MQKSVFRSQHTDLSQLHLKLTIWDAWSRPVCCPSSNRGESLVLLGFNPCSWTVNRPWSYTEQSFSYPRSRRNRRWTDPWTRLQTQCLHQMCASVPWFPYPITLWSCPATLSVANKNSSLLWKVGPVLLKMAWRLFPRCILWSPSLVDISLNSCCVSSFKITKLIIAFWSQNTVVMCLACHHPADWNGWAQGEAVRSPCDKHWNTGTWFFVSPSCLPELHLWASVCKKVREKRGIQRIRECRFAWRVGPVDLWSGLFSGMSWDGKCYIWFGTGTWLEKKGKAIFGCRHLEAKILFPFSWDFRLQTCLWPQRESCFLTEHMMRWNHWDFRCKICLTHNRSIHHPTPWFPSGNEALTFGSNSFKTSRNSENERATCTGTSRLIRKSSTKWNSFQSTEFWIKYEV